MAGAVVCGWAFSKLPDGKESPVIVTLILLGSCTWLFYILDRLLDLRIYPKDHTERHFFHFENQYNLQLIIISLIVINACLVFFLPKKVFYFGLVLLVGVVFYFWVLNRFFRATKVQWVKEPTTAICYCLAVVGTALISKPSISLSMWLLSGIFFLITLQNLLVFSYFEYLESTDNENVISKLGIKKGRKIIFGITSTITFLVVFFFINGGSYVNFFAITELLMSLVLSLLITAPTWATKANRYRWLGDGVFLFPLLLLFWV